MCVYYIYPNDIPIVQKVVVDVPQKKKKNINDHYEPRFSTIKVPFTLTINYYFCIITINILLTTINH